MVFRSAIFSRRWRAHQRVERNESVSLITPEGHVQHWSFVCGEWMCLNERTGSEHKETVADALNAVANACAIGERQ